GTAPLRELMFSVPAQVVAGLSGLDEPAALEASRLVADFVQCIPASATAEQQAGAARAAAALRSLLGPALTEDNAGMLGELVRADRTDAALYTFGAAAHRCPGETVAVTIAAAVVAELLAQGFDPTALDGPVRYLPLANARIPIL